MATVNLYNNKSDKIVVQKDITLVVTCEAEFLSDVSLTHPSVILHVDPAFLDANYVYIKEFKRYYYIDGMTILDGHRLMINCRVDVLMSFCAYILNSNQHVIRQEVAYNLGVSDEDVPVLAGTFIQYKNLDTVDFRFNSEDSERDYCYVLNVVV